MLRGATETAVRVIAQALGGELWGDSRVTDPATGKVWKAVFGAYLTQDCEGLLQGGPDPQLGVGLSMSF